MKTHLAILLLVLPLVFVAGRLSAGEEDKADPAPAAPETVTAVRYKMFFVESGLEWSHGGGRWGQELYFPERGIVCNLIHEPGSFEENFRLHPKVHAFENPIRNRYAIRPGEEEIVAATEEIEVPAAIADRIFAFAELSKRQSEESENLGGALEKEGLLVLVDDYLRKLRDSDD